MICTICGDREKKCLSCYDRECGILLIRKNIKDLEAKLFEQKNKLREILVKENPNRRLQLLNEPI